MDFTHGHVGHHRHHNRRDDDGDDNNNTFYPPPPPSFNDSPYPPPPHQMDHNYPPPPHQTYPPPPSYGGAYDSPPSFHSSYAPPPQNYPPPQQPSYGHHEGGGGGGGVGGGPSHHSFQPHMPGFMGSHFHHGGSEDHGGESAHSYGGGPDAGPGSGLGHLLNKPSHQIHCKAGGERFAVGIRDGKVVLIHPDHSDETQHWYKDEKYSTKVKDKDGYPSFMWVNKGTGQAVKHSISCHPVQLAPYKPDVLDESVLWTESKDLGSGFRTIRTVNNIHLVVDAWNADKDHGGIHDGTVLALYETWKGDNKNQQWKFSRHCKALSPASQSNC